MSASNLNRSVPARTAAPARTATPANWSRREAAVSAVFAVTSAFIAVLAWTTPMSFAARLLDTAVACGGLSMACAPRLLFLPTALREARAGGLIVPRLTLRLSLLGRCLLLAAAGSWLGAQLL